jgi:3-phenylpropionate/trans-cinnamate dioxygenase ferredoxin reductase subunit
MRQAFVIVGGGLTAGAAASTLRDEGFDGDIVLIGQERHPPYERPPMSKEYLRGEQPFAKSLLLPESWYAEHGVELLLGTRVERIDPADRVVQLEDGGAVSYDRVLVATGGRNRHMPVPGHDLEGILALRTVEDADVIRSEAAPGRKAVLVGAGFIGSEVAASLRSMGVDVEVIEMFDLPLQRVVGHEIGRLYQTIHEEHGVRFHFGQTVQRFEGSRRVEAVVTDRDLRIDCDFAVVAVGIEPSTRTVAGSVFEVDNGILVDERCRTNVPDVFAAGDVANHLHPVFGRRFRVEHYDNALKQGTAAARSMLGSTAAFDDLHWFWSDQYEHNLQYLGHAPVWDELVIRGNMQERSFVGFYLKRGVVDAVVGMNRGREVRRSANLIRSRRPVDPDMLRRDVIDLKALGAELLHASRAEGSP